MACSPLFGASRSWKAVILNTNNNFRFCHLLQFLLDYLVDAANKMNDDMQGIFAIVLWYGMINSIPRSSLTCDLDLSPMLGTHLIGG